MKEISTRSETVSNAPARAGRPELSLAETVAPTRERSRELSLGATVAQPAQLDATLAAAGSAEPELAHTLAASADARSTVALRPAERDGDGPPRRVTPARGDEIGRFVVLAELGAGGMGAVYAAFDPELDRKVAIKLLHDHAHTSRLLREAQSLARLAHPNVVAVFDVGRHAGGVWLAMEYVEGRTLHTWLKEHAAKRPWRARIARALDAARGVAAAHAAGIIHRDLKPDNVMVGDDGRVRVMDFGLARAGAESTIDPGESDAALLRSRNASLDIELTAAGAILGTPAYMAPEQFLGAATDERTDQFALN